jgi:two-component system nitrogen regulation sensor histidine kinase NtrY
VKVVAGPDLTLLADSDQLEQMLINLLRNAADAVIEEAGQDQTPSGPGTQAKDAPVVLSWTKQPDELIIRIEDTGPGLMNPTNAFVPFYTTKPKGSGIGLVLSRQIAEAHGGSLELKNRPDRHGCVVTIALPVRMPS